MSVKIMEGKRGIIMGLANDRSLAYGIAEKLFEQGAEIAFAYQAEALKSRVEPIAKSFGSDFLIECDVSKDGDIQKMFDTLKAKWGKIDFVVHALAFSDKSELKGPYYNTSKKNFLNALNISCYSFTETCKCAMDIMNAGGSLVTLTYYGAEKVMPNYNVMGVAKAALECSVRYLANDMGPHGIRVNALSSGPVRTLAASGISDFRAMLKWTESNAPLRRNTTLEDVGGAGLYLLSQLSSGVTGETHYVDSGYNIIGMKALDDEE
ncbi:MAG: enoyl-[acyl-carrier-protein] reductase FabI [Alphaproteobacteria bacterium CG_4_10_14_0_8_um_filter_37_21]|nr:MAG: enoyl-[acyl-carrier-protein] reductase FabI [Alphaproteobacteria bacterium CG_4_10_14_0_8_um_filter_37_21]